MNLVMPSIEIGESTRLSMILIAAHTQAYLGEALYSNNISTYKQEIRVAHTLIAQVDSLT